MSDTPMSASATRVLVIDDEDYVADMIASALTMDGYTAYVAYNGVDGLASAQRFQTDLIILDLMMPYMDGETVVKQLRAQEATRAVPIILISAGARPSQSLAGLAFVTKPFDIKRLLREVRTQLHI